MTPSPEADSSLAEWLDYLERIHSMEIELGLERVLLVYRRLLPRGCSARVVTVAGTNGKGSTVHALEHLLRSEGRSTGAYTSPHMQRFNERMRINGEEVSDSGITEAFQAVENVRQRTPLTYFEFSTLAALWLFQQHGVDYLLLEVGLGGRLDAVNIVDPDLAIITSVDLDHTQWLGEDRDRIGYEKAGILRPDMPALFGDPEPPESVLQQARAQRVELRVLGRDFGSSDNALVLDGPAGEETVPLAGKTLSPGQITALQAFLDLGFAVTAKTLDVLVNTPGVPGRFERITGEPELVLDVGHNPHAARWLAQRLKGAPCSGRTIAVYAALSDKDVAGVAAALSDRISHWCLAGLSEPRGLAVDDLAARVSPVLQYASVSTSDTVAEALESALAIADPADRILVFGSFHTVGAVRGRLE